MTFKVTDKPYGRLSYRQLSFLFILSPITCLINRLNTTDMKSEQKLAYVGSEVLRSHKKANDDDGADNEKKERQRKGEDENNANQP